MITDLQQRISAALKRGASHAGTPGPVQSAPVVGGLLGRDRGPRVRAYEWRESADGVTRRGVTLCLRGR